MDEFFLGVRIFLSTLFLSTGISKFNNMKLHIESISNYNFFKKEWNNKLAWLDSIAELIIGFFLFFGFLQLITFSLAILLLILYIIAMSINLLKGLNFSCGCGGITGNHNISWFLVIRNLVLIFIFIITGYYNTPLFSLDTQLRTGSLNGFFEIEYVPIIFSTWIIILIFTNSFNLYKIKQTEERY